MGWGGVLVVGVVVGVVGGGVPTYVMKRHEREVRVCKGQPTKRGSAGVGQLRMMRRRGRGGGTSLTNVIVIIVVVTIVVVVKVVVAVTDSGWRGCL